MTPLKAQGITVTRVNPSEGMVIILNQLRSYKYNSHANTVGRHETPTQYQSLVEMKRRDEEMK